MILIFSSSRKLGCCFGRFDPKMLSLPSFSGFNPMKFLHLGARCLGENMLAQIGREK
jgi:hypothetical protein